MKDPLLAYDFGTEQHQVGRRWMIEQDDAQMLKRSLTRQCTRTVRRALDTQMTSLDARSHQNPFQSLS